jgi:putative inorganic carbon (hco3(-)) transporter
MTVFSTFAERGPCATFLALALIPVLVSGRWRITFGWPEALFILSTIVLTLVRTCLILIVVAVLIHPLLNRGRAAAGIIFFVGLVGLAGFAGLSHMPNADRIGGRLSTFGHMKEDASFKGRLGIASAGMSLAASNPIGYGIGSSGLGGRLNSGSVNSEALIGDNGYLEDLTSLGVPGSLLLAASIFLLWRHLSTCSRFGLVDEYIGLTKTFIVVLLIGMFAGNYLSGLSVVWIAAGQALSPRMMDKLMLVDEPEFEIHAPA